MPRIYITDEVDRMLAIRSLLDGKQLISSRDPDGTIWVDAEVYAAIARRALPHEPLGDTIKRILSDA